MANGTTLASAQAAEDARSALRLGLFAILLATQLGHLAEHILVALSGAPVFGQVANNEAAHLAFNGLVAAFALVLIQAFPRNPWVYPLGLLSVVHAIEHAFIYEAFLHSGTSHGPGLLGVGGAIGVIPLDRLHLHNIYNGSEMVLMALGFAHEIYSRTEKE